MDGHSSSHRTQEQGASRRRTLRSHRNRDEGGGSDSEAAANSPHQRPAPFRRRSTRTRPTSSFTDTLDLTTPSASSSTQAHGEPSLLGSSNAAARAEVSARGREPRFSLYSSGASLRRGRDSAVGSPSRGDLSPTSYSLALDDTANSASYESDLSAALEDGLLGEGLLRSNPVSALRRAHTRPHSSVPQSGTATPPRLQTNSGFPPYLSENSSHYDTDDASRATTFEYPRASAGDLFGRPHLIMGGSLKRAMDKLSNEESKHLLDVLKQRGAASAMLYRTAEPNPEANDIWPNYRSRAKLPVRYALLDVTQDAPSTSMPHGRPEVAKQDRYELRGQKARPCPQDPRAPIPSKGRPFWQLPVELVEQIIGHLNRDDVKSLRLVSRELNEYTSQAAFKTVVVPFNTEIYGMLGQEPKTDRKGKKRAKISRPEYWWKNANGDEVYNGHGLDVFRGFGRHILRYGMSFEVNEDSLCAPPLKSVTEQKTSFWGNYQWPFEEYRRFDAVAGLESAADETPRMKTAFSELTKVKELALSVDSGLGWLNGPDRSLRARILQSPPNMFGSRQYAPDRRTQAQRELWGHIESMHARAGEDVRLSMLYRLEGARPVTEAQAASLMATAQPGLPFLDAHVPYEATPHGFTNFIPSLEDSQLFEHHAMRSLSVSGGILFTSTALQHHDAAESPSYVVPASLSQAQKEWLLETEWAQRAFMSSYMLSIIDNQPTFALIHTLNISSLSDRYLPLLNRADFWNALPSLENVILMVIPGWRTVEKDEAGFVETPRVDPTSYIDVFRALLEDQVAPRPKIARLTVGYTASGEHAEGLHARNKLLMPAPVLPLKARMHTDPALPPLETAIVQGGNLLRQVLVRFPHLEELTLRNCWITPSALLQFVKVHDKCSLKRLTLDSISLTAVLQPVGNGQAANPGPQPAPPNAAIAQQIVGAVWAQAHNNAGPIAPAANQLMGNGQVLHNYVQVLIAQLQQMQGNAAGIQQHHLVHALHAQLQQHLQNVQALTVQQPQGDPLANNGQHNQQAQQQNNLAQVTQLNHLVAQVTFLQQIMPIQNAPTAPADDTSGTTDSILQTRPREGSWMDIIDQISPGTNLVDFSSTHSRADPSRTTSLEAITFNSCGYAKLPHLGLSVDQSPIEHSDGVAAALRNPFFTKRHNALAPRMLNAKWQYLGEIVQEVDLTELAALDAGWNLRHGWDDAEAARAAEFDGLLAGGTGRFSGTVRREDRVTNAGAG